MSFGEGKKEKNRTMPLKGLDLCVPAWPGVMVSRIILLRLIFLSSPVFTIFSLGKPEEPVENAVLWSSLKLKEPALLC